MDLGVAKIEEAESELNAFIERRAREKADANRSCRERFWQKLNYH